MSELSKDEITILLQQWSGGDQEALKRLMPLVYHELKIIAKNAMRRETDKEILQPTMIVNEVYLRLVNQRQINMQSRAQFFGLAGQLTRRILVDYARRRQREKRGGSLVTISLEQIQDIPTPAAKLDLVNLDSALAQLEKLSERQCRIVELRFFAGLSVEEAGLALGVSAPTIKREWAIARTFLFIELGKEKS